MFWKLYFWVFIVLIIIGYSAEGADKSWGFIIDTPLTICAFAGLFAYAYRKKILNKHFWKIFLPVYVLWELYYNIFLLEEPSFSNPEERIYIIIGYSLFVPFYVALYRYAFKFLEGKENVIEKDESDINQLDNIALPTVTRRYLSTFIDSTLVILMFIAISFIFPQDTSNFPFIRLTLIIIMFLIYEPFLTSKFCTLGQKITGIRVREINSLQKISILSAYGRIIVKMILGMISFFTIPFTKGKRAIHDFAVDSVVIFDYQDNP